ncbi:class I SAM-dependent methyltransferase [Pasteurellaceae bacterium 22721_9_1]
MPDTEKRDSSQEQALDYIFSQDWFSHNIPSLQAVIHFVKPTRILEIGSFEGRSTVFFAEESLKYQERVQIQCIDTWLGAREHVGLDMLSVEQRFSHNAKLVTSKLPNIEILERKGTSHQMMINLLAEGYHNYFDFIYVDGSHEAPDVLFDALLAHRLVRVGGVIAFDDYLWSPNAPGEDDHYLLVKPAVDHYINTYQRKVQVLQGLPAYQLYAHKLAD